jgi:IclR family transcriptional regulator, acetate operon repressor
MCPVAARPSEIPSGSSEDASARIQSVGRAAMILRAVAESPNGLSARELSGQLGISLPTLYHLIQSLRVEGLLQRSGDGRSIMGAGVGVLARGLERHREVPEELVGAVRELAELTGESSYLSGWRQNEIAVLAFRGSEKPVSVSPVAVGLADKAHARASGKLLLALTDEKERERYFEGHASEPMTENTLTGAKLERELEEIPGRGYAVDREEYAEGVSCMAVPVKYSGEMYALAVSVPTMRFETASESILAALEQTAKRL